MKQLQASGAGHGMKMDQEVGFALTTRIFLPDHWHATIYPPFPVTISRVRTSIKVSPNPTTTRELLRRDCVSDRISLTMAPQELEGEFRKIIGDLGAPLAKLSKSDKAALKHPLDTDAANGLDPAWELRSRWAAGLALPEPICTATLIAKALAVEDIARNLGRLCTSQKVIDASAPATALDSKLSVWNVESVLSVLPRVGKKLATAPSGTALSRNAPTVLRNEAAVALLRTIQRAAQMFLDQEPPKLTKQQRQRRTAAINSILDLAFIAADGSRSAQVCGAALELVDSLGKRLGFAPVEEAMEGEWFQFTSLPGVLITDLISKGCLRDAEFLAYRARLLPESKLSLENAIRTMLREAAPTVPMASREWPEEFLGQKKVADVRSMQIDASSDVTLERMAVLLLASWDAKEDGERALQLFQLVSGVCRNGFRLSLGGDLDQITPFDRAFHEASGVEILPGQLVKLSRPWVQWGDGSTVRIIIRALAELPRQAPSYR